MLTVPEQIATLVYDNSLIGEQNDLTSRGVGLFYDLFGANATASSMVAWVWGVSRIIAGRCGGHRLHTPQHDRTRPTTDRVREAVFSTLATWAGGTEGGPQDALSGPAMRAGGRVLWVGMEGVQEGGQPLPTPGLRLPPHPPESRAEAAG